MKQKLLSWGGAVLGLGAGLSNTDIGLANSQTCQTNGGIRVCVSWSQGSPPDDPENFHVTFNGSNPPEIELFTGDPEWNVYVTNAAGTIPWDIGSLTTQASDDFVVSIVNADDHLPGAVNVDEVDLQPSGNHHASLVESVVSGNILGLSLKRYNGNGGVLTLRSMATFTDTGRSQ